jgi:DNA-binding LacI/PurR family transcriptional regulator
MAPTIKQIAELARVSPATVSLALNNKPGVSPSTRERVLAIAETLQRTDGARSFNALIKGSVRFLKIVKHSHIVNRDHDVFIAAYIEGMDKEARKGGYNLEITSITHDQIGEFVSHLNCSASKGLIVLGTELNARDIREFEGVNVPIVVIDTTFDFITLDFVDMNNTEALFQIVRYFMENNHFDIGLIWGEQVEARNFELRRLAFEQALKYFGLPFNPRNVITVDSTFTGAYEGMMAMLKKGLRLPTALVSANDLIASACLKAFKETGIRVPDDVSIIGFDNLPMCEMLDPPLTTMRVSKQQIGETAMELLIGRINHRIGAPTLKISVGGQLVIRKSVRCITDSPRGFGGPAAGTLSRSGISLPARA